MNSESPQSSGESTSPQEPIQKGAGVTSAERYLARLCEKNFLSLWSYPGVYRDQGKRSIDCDGKEICDLLVVFDKHVVIFSDKHCELQDSGIVQRDWQRWFKKAIQKSAEQAWGAERWLRQQPNRVFLDRQCKQKLPIDLPPIEKTVFHLIVVAHGVSSRVRQHFPNSSGSLVIDTSLKGFAGHAKPFCVGDLDSQKSLIHVLDDDSLHTLMSTRDTISDFVAYLSAREKLFRGQRAICATGEEQLLAVYLKSLNDKNEHDFIFPIEPGQNVNKIYLLEGHWEEFQKAPERIAQLDADKISYSWDRLIEKFNYYALRREQYYVTDGGLKDSEMVLRFMAREPRWKRRYLAEAILDMLRTTPSDKRRLRVLPPVDKGDPYYLFLLLPTLYAETEDQYRTVRRNFLESCCAVVKLEYPDAEDIVGIATEPGMGNDSRSEDAIYFDARSWNSEMQAMAKEHQEKLGILKKPRRIVQHVEEYPDVRLAKTGAKIGRNEPCPCGSGKKYKRCCLRN
jgi:hypothetical protein